MTGEDPAILAELSALAEGLAGFLREADQVDRLLTFVRDDRRLARRFDPGVGSWAGFQDDLEAAWDALDRRLARPERDAVDPVPDLIRLALVRATISSADDLPPALIAAAIRTGTRTVERALSTVGRHPSPDQRAAMLCELLGITYLDEDLRRTIRSQLVELAYLPPPELPAQALVTALDQLEPAERLTVTDQVAAGAVVLSVGIGDNLHTGPRVLPETAVRAIETIPESRRPAFISAVLDSLLRSLAESRRPERESAPPARPTGQWQPLYDVQFQDSIQAAWDPRRSRVRAAALLTRLVGFLPALPADQRAAHRVAGAIASVPDAAARDDLVTAFRAAFPGHDVAWPATGGTSADDTAGDQARYRQRLMEQIHGLTGRGFPASAPDDDTFLSPSLDGLHDQWLSTVLPSLFGDTPWPPEEERPEEAEASERDVKRVLAEIRRIGGPVFVGTAAAKGKLPDEVLYQLVREAADPRDLGGQLYIASSLAQRLSEDEATGPAVVPKVKAGLLMAALDHHFRDGAIRSAWRGAEPEFLADVEWDAVLAFALTLPAEKQRGALDRLNGDVGPPDVDRIPRLAALCLLLPHLSAGQVEVAFADAVALSDPWVRRLALGLVAPRLDAGQVARALRALDGAGDDREQAWFLIELSRRLGSTDPRLAQVTRWSLDAVAGMRSGTDFGLIVSVPLPREAGPVPEGEPELAEGFPVTRALSTLSGMDDNNRTDALFAIAAATKGQLPAGLFQEMLRLPVVNAAGKYSARGSVISALAGRFPDECLAAAFTAAMELPHRLEIGDAQAWGWNWGYEYPRGAALLALAPRLSGELAAAAFDACRDLPWVAREPVLQGLARQADAPLAAAIFDYSFQVHREYMALPETAGVPWRLEDTVVTDPVDVFKIGREVHLAEVIAAVAGRLDPARLGKAVAQAQAFDNFGPRAWLPARLLPLLDEDRREPMLSSAALAAQEYIAEDPSRLDLITDLTPYLRVEIARRREPVDRFLAQRFPGRRELLTMEEVHRLPGDEREEYARLLGVDLLFQAKEAAGRVAHRAALIRVMLSPVLDGEMQRILMEALVAAPLEARVNALEGMKQLLEPASHARVVAVTLRQVMAAEMEPMGRVRLLALLVPHLGQPARDRLVAEASRLPGPSAGAEEQRRRDFTDMAMKDFGKAAKPDPRFDDLRHNVTARMVERTMSDMDGDVIRRTRGPRVQLLEVLGPALSEAGVARAVDLVLALPDETERADGISALLPVASGEPRRRLRAALTGLTSPLARWWALFNSQEALSAYEGGDLALTAFARSTAEDFRDPKEVAVFLLMLIGYAGDERPRWIRRAAALSDLLPVNDRLRTLGMVTQIAVHGPDRGQMVAAHVCAMPTAAAVHDGWVMATRLGVDGTVLTGAQLSQLRQALSARLRKTAQRGRAELLRVLAGESTGIAGLTASDGIAEIARAVRDICVEWRWPTGS